MKRLIVVSVFAFVSLAVVAGEGKDGWTGKAGLGLDVASGNSEVTAATLNIEAGYVAGANKYSMTASYGYAEADEALSRQNSRIAAAYDRALSEMTYLYVRAENEYDKIAQIDSRLTTGPGVGVFLLKKDSISLKCDAGLSYIDQKLRDDSLDNTKDGVLALRVTERFDVKLSENASAWQSLEYLPDTDDFDSYLMNAEIGMETRVTGSTSLRVVAASRRDSVPVEGVEKDDFSVKAALAFAFGG